MEVYNIWKTFRSGEHTIEALKGVSFTLRKGEFAAIMGSSGSGKSTLMHVLGGMERQTRGEIWIEGEDVTRILYNEPMSTLFRRKKIGFVFQSFNLLSALTAEDNIALPLVLSGEKRKQISQAVEEMLRFVGLQERGRHRPSQLSGGQQQRVAIARALVHRPPILLADEPTGNLDTATTAEILNLFNMMRETFGLTILMVTHDPHVAAHADRVIHLRDGNIDQQWANDSTLEPSARTDLILDRLREAAG